MFHRNYRSERRNIVPIILETGRDLVRLYRFADVAFLSTGRNDRESERQAERQREGEREGEKERDRDTS